MVDPRRVTLVVLAGGRATRLPGKLDLPVGGEPMLARVVRRLRSPDVRCIVSVRSESEAGLAHRLGCEAVVDDIEGAGPLAGLAAAAAAARTPLLFAAAGDLVNLDATFIQRLVRAFDTDDADAVVPRWPDGKLEPLAALYATGALVSGARAALKEHRFKVTAALDGLRVRHEALTPADEALLANVNTPDDYAAIDAARSTP